MRFLISWDPEHIREQAAASTARYAAGAPLSPLDGVPFAVKDGGDAAPYPTTAGTAFMAAWWGIASCTLLRVFFWSHSLGGGSRAHCVASAAHSVKTVAQARSCRPCVVSSVHHRSCIRACTRPVTNTQRFHLSCPGRRKPTGTNPGVASLMSAGAILIGKANLHEIGCSTTGE